MKKCITCVLTGGPCAGKTSSLNHMKKKLTEQGFKVYTVMEVATMLLENGCSYPGLDPSKREELLNFEKNLIQLQIDLENAFIGIASQSSQRSVIICDRAACDVAAYVPEEIFESVLSNMNQTRISLIARYDVVCHLVTAAEGAESFYSNANNSSRLETASEARVLDQKSQACWAEHPRRRIIDNCYPGGFPEKLEAATTFVLESIAEL